MMHGSTNFKLCARVAGGLCPTDLLVGLIYYFLHSYKK